MKKTGFAILGLLLIFLPALGHSKPGSLPGGVSFEIQMVNDPGFQVVVDRYDCEDPIYLIANWEGLPEGLHQMTVIWIDPQKEQIDTHDQKFSALDQPVHVWSSLKFSNPRRTSGFFVTRPSKLHGEWSARVFLDGRHVATQNFRVHCE